MKAKTDLPIFYVYEHWRPDTDVCFWVGKGHRRRAWRFSKRNQHHINIVSKLERNGLLVDVRIILSDMTEVEALKAEIDRITYWRDRGNHLCNQTEGGEGVCGLKHSLETRGKIKIGRKRRKNRPTSDETKAKISAANKGLRKGQSRPEHSARLKGRKHSPEHRAKISAGLTGRVFSAESRAKISKAHIGKKRPPETRERLRLSHLGKTLSAETKRKMSIARKRNAALESKEARSARVIKAWEKRRASP